MNVEIKIRKATQLDRDALCQIHVSAIRGLGTSHYSAAEVDAWSRGRVLGWGKKIACFLIYS